MSQTYIFHRENSFYPIELADDADAIKNAENNPGTLKVTDAHGSRIVWEANQKLPADAITLRKIDSDEMKDHQHYLVLCDGRYDTAHYNSEFRTLTCQRYRIPNFEATAIYELPK